MEFFKLNNDIEVLHKRNINTPRVALYFNMSLNHMSAKPSAYSLMTKLFMQGTKTRSAEKLSEELDKYAILPEKLECEITETKHMQNPELERETVRQLRDMGIRLSIDDFGSGHASFNYLKDLDAHKLKIDRDFIQSLFEKPANETIMRTIIGLGHSLNLIVLAEGIETSEQEKWLRDNGCDFGQGFWFSRPLPLTMLIPFLRAHQEKQKG
jgi:EAL domain-containing protein (putative c-di-GMP-specific phosphodiesterase class I)